MRFENSNLEGGGRLGGGGRGVGLGAGADGLADLGGVQVVVDESVYDVGEVALDDGVADDLQGAAQQSADPLHEVDDLLLGGVAGEEVVDVLDDVHADVAHEVPRLLGGGPGRGGEAEHGEGELVHGGGHG